ncbi:MAG: hypothetical protein M3Q48_06975 [Actinomycetota bacterium]|nr:hypothetical protein [Actinomycetota bacterium]
MAATRNEAKRLRRREAGPRVNDQIHDSDVWVVVDGRWHVCAAQVENITVVRPDRLRERGSAPRVCGDNEHPERHDDRVEVCNSKVSPLCKVPPIDELSRPTGEICAPSPRPVQTRPVEQAAGVALIVLGAMFVLVVRGILGEALFGAGGALKARFSRGGRAVRRRAKDREARIRARRRR